MNSKFHVEDQKAIVNKSSSDLHEITVIRKISHVLMFNSFGDKMVSW